MSILPKSGARPASDIAARPSEALRQQTLGRSSLLPPLLLALLALLGTLLASTLRPSVTIDVGDYYDKLYLSGFHDREVAPVNPQLRIEWPQGSQELLIPSPNPSLRLGILRLAPAMADSDWGTALVFVNGKAIYRLDADKGAEFQFRLPEVAGDMRVLVWHETKLGATPIPIRVESLTLARAQTYRWFTEEGTILLPGLGRGSWLVSLAATVAHPNGGPVDARLLANDVQIAALPDSAERRHYQLLLPANVAADGDVVLRLRAQPFVDPRPLGVLVEQVAVRPLGEAPLRPPWSMLGAMLALSLASYASLTRLRTPRWWSAAGCAALVAALTWALIAYHGIMGFYLPRLALLALATLALVLALEPLLAWVFRRAGVPLAPWLRNGLLLLFVGGLWLKAGAMLWPYFIGIDVAWHMERVMWVLNGRLAEMYRPGGFSESVMPANEWGNQKPIIPYSPFFHIFATVFTLSPLPLVLTAHLFSALVDNSRVFLIALLARRSGLSSRAALLAAALYAVTPVTFLLHSWGNIPTTFGLWWTLVSTTFIVVAYRRLDQRWPFVALTLLLTVTFLMYTVSGVFMGGFLVFLIAGLLIWNRREGRRPALAILWATVAAGVLVTIIYYGQYIPLIIERTLPYFGQTITQGQASVGAEQENFWVYLSKYPRRLGYSGRPLYFGLLLPLLFFPLALPLQRSRRLTVVMLSWMALALLFVVVGVRVPMVDKQVFYAVPLLALAGGIVFAGLWRRGRNGRLVTLAFYAFTLAAALDLWLYRVANVQQ